MKSLKRCGKKMKKVCTFSQHLALRGLAPGLDEVASRTSMRNLRSFVQHSRKLWQNVTKYIADCNNTCLKKYRSSIIMLSYVIYCHIMSAVCTSKELCFCDAADCSALPSWVRPCAALRGPSGHSLRSYCASHKVMSMYVYVVSGLYLVYILVREVLSLLSVGWCCVGIHSNKVITAVW